MANLRVTLVQPSLDNFENKGQFREHIRSKLLKDINSKTTNLLIFPDLFSTGPTLDVSLAEDLTYFNQSVPATYPATIAWMHLLQELGGAGGTKGMFRVGIIGGGFYFNTGSGSHVYTRTENWINTDGGGNIIRGRYPVVPEAHRIDKIHLSPFLEMDDSLETNVISPGISERVAGVYTEDRFDFAFQFAYIHDLLYANPPFPIRDGWDLKPHSNKTSIKLLIVLGCWTEEEENDTGKTWSGMLLEESERLADVYIIGVNSCGEKEDSKGKKHTLIGQTQICYNGSIIDQLGDAEGVLTRTLTV